MIAAQSVYPPGIVLHVLWWILVVVGALWVTFVVVAAITAFFKWLYDE